MTTNEHLKRIEAQLILRGGCSLSRPPVYACPCKLCAGHDAALESLTALREQIAQMERDCGTFRQQWEEAAKDRDTAEHCQAVLGNETRLLRQRIESLTAERDQARDALRRTKPTPRTDAAAPPPEPRS